MNENKLFTQEAVNAALRACVFGSLGLASPKKLSEDLASLPESLDKMVIASILAGHVTLLKYRSSKAGSSLEQEVLKAIEESQRDKEDNSTTN